MTYKGYKITVKRDKASDMLEARLWSEGRVCAIMPCLFEFKDDAVEGATGWIDEILKYDFYTDTLEDKKFPYRFYFKYTISKPIWDIFIDWLFENVGIDNWISTQNGFHFKTTSNRQRFIEYISTR